MARPGWIAAALLVIPGVVFVGQGLGLLRSSSLMVEDMRWTWIGAAMVIVGLALGPILARRRRA